jgi:hypothetical protein
MFKNMFLAEFYSLDLVWWVCSTIILVCEASQPLEKERRKRGKEERKRNYKKTLKKNVT